jgi:hypothetical protein
MKKLIIFILFAASLIFAQENNKGRISFVFNGEKIDLPVSNVTIAKYDNIILNARAEYNDSTVQQVISLEIGFKKLSSGDSALYFPFNIYINLKNNSNDSGENLTFSYTADGPKSGNEKHERAHFGVYSKGESLSWDVNRLQVTYDIANIIYTGKELKITGSFSGKFQSKIGPEGQIAEIKDGKFEIII